MPIWESTYPNLTDLESRFTKASASAPASQKFHEDTDNGSNYIEVKAPAALGSNRSHELPDEADGVLATRAWAQALFESGNWKTAVRAASTANVSIANGLENGDTIDGLTLATGDRVLLKDQTAPAENGVYVVVASGAASRSTDTDNATDIEDMAVFVQEGTANGNSRWQLTTNNPITLGTTALTFTAMAGGGVTNSAGNNVIPKSDGTNLVASYLQDDGSTGKTVTWKGDSNSFYFETATGGDGASAKWGKGHFIGAFMAGSDGVSTLGTIGSAQSLIAVSSFAGSDVAVRMHNNAAGQPVVRIYGGGASQTADLLQFTDDYSGTTVYARFNKFGLWQPPTSTNAAAPNNSVFYSSDNSKFVYKDSGGTVNNLY